MENEHRSSDIVSVINKTKGQPITTKIDMVYNKGEKRKLCHNNNVCAAMCQR